MSLSQTAEILQVQFCGQNKSYNGISIDSRCVKDGELFVALIGENFDGHEFVSSAKRNGAAAAMVSKNVDCDLPLLKVKDTLSGLQQLATRQREQMDIPVVGITGSNGKTTVKELVSAILKSKYACVLVTQGNLNNHIGVPLTLLNLTQDHQCAVIEMGMNHPGEISELTKMATPTIALVNNAMIAHVHAFDTVKDIAKAKGEIFEGLPEDGIAILNADDPHYLLWKEMIGDRMSIDFGFESTAQITANIQYQPDHLMLEISTPRDTFTSRLNLLGKHNAMNALAAVAVAYALNVDVVDIREGLEKVYPVNGRLQPIQINKNLVVVNDTYNANPDSMKAGLDVLMQMAAKNKIFVAGDMGELGEDAKSYHQMIGEYAKHCGVDSFITIGPLMKSAVHSFGVGGFNTQNINQLIETLKQQMTNDCVILIKGSRSMKMERVVYALESAYSEVLR